MLRKMVVPGMVAVLLTTGMGATACGGGDDGVSKSDLVAKIKEDPELKSMPDSVIDCVADVYIKYGDKEELKAVIDGKRSTDKEIKGLDLNNKQVKAEMEACVTKK